jgi:predicted site-specific integrase-resolvase
VVYEQTDKSPEQEFTEDILAILQVFACRWNGKRKYHINKNKEVQIEVKQLTKEEIKDVGSSLPDDLQQSN